MTTIDLKSKFTELESIRDGAVKLLDAAIEDIRALLDLDNHLVRLGLQDTHQLEHEEPWPHAGQDVEEVQEATPPPEAPEAPVVESKGKRRRWSDDEKADGVRLADEYGNDSKAEREIGAPAGSIHGWRKAGHGKKMKSVVGTAAIAQAEKEPGGGPTTKCPVCKASVPIEGEVGIDSRPNALRKHYSTSPDCRTALRARHA